MNRRQSSIYSISGQIESVVAEIMEKEGCYRILPHHFPETVSRWDAQGRPVTCALMMTPQQSRRFNELVANLRA